MALILAISDSKEYQFLNKNAELHGKNLTSETLFLGFLHVYESLQELIQFNNCEC